MEYMDHLRAHVEAVAKEMPSAPSLTRELLGRRGVELGWWRNTVPRREGVALVEVLGPSDYLRAAAEAILDHDERFDIGWTVTDTVGGESRLAILNCEVREEFKSRT
jgi:hypothetical protein